MIKSLLLWMLILAMPFQGFASASMLTCAPLSPAMIGHTSEAARSFHHDHVTSFANQMSGQHCHIAAQQKAVIDDGGHASSDYHAGGKCGSCSVCSCGASIAQSDMLTLPFIASRFAHGTFDSGSIPIVDLAFPERPPQTPLI